MGTYYTNGATKNGIIAELLNPLKKAGVLVASAVQRETDGEYVLWTVEAGKRNGEEYQFIGCYVLRPDPSGWGYKPMEETMGPFFYSVPKKWLDKYPCKMTTEHKHMLVHSEAWRQMQRATISV
jgi:hypothetical protein